MKELRIRVISPDLLISAEEFRTVVRNSTHASAHSSAICDWAGTYGRATCAAVWGLVGGIHPCKEDPTGYEFGNIIDGVRHTASIMFRPNSEEAKQFGLQTRISKHRRIT